MTDSSTDQDTSEVDQCPDCEYVATDKVDAYVHVLLDHDGGLSNV